MRTIHILGILVLLALVVPAAPAHAGGVVEVCDEAHLLAALVGGGTVTFTCSGTITLTAEIVIGADTTIDGSGQAVTISGNNVVRVLYVNPEVTLNLNELTISYGRVSEGDGGGVFSSTGSTVTVSNSTFSNNSAQIGGGIASSSTSTLTVRNSTFANNSASDGGGGVFLAFDGVMTVNNSTFSSNTTSSGGGGGILDNGIVTVINSTFADNSSTSSYGDGGGIHNGHFGTLTVSNSTFSNNSAYVGGGIFSFAHFMTLRNTIVANSPMGGNCYSNEVIIDGGGNLSYPDATCPGMNADPVLGPLQNNGGPTLTMALGPGSAAIDAADDAICAAPPVNNLDQRGVTRPQGAHCDIGAVEQFLEPAAVSVSVLSAQSVPGTITPAMVAGLLLAVLMAVGVRRRQRHMI